jgi:HEAT repeat protein
MTGVGLTRPSRGLMVLVMGAGVLAVACRRGTQQPAAPSPAAPSPPPSHSPLALGAVSLRDISTSGVLSEPLDLNPLQDRLRDRLAGSGIFAAPAPDAGAALPLVRLHGEVALDGAEVEDKGVARALVRLVLDTRPSEVAGAIDETLAAQGEQVYPIRRKRPGAKGGDSTDEKHRDRRADEQRALFARLVQRVASDLLDGFLAREKLRSAPAAAIHAALSADGGDLQEQAIRIAGERRLRDEVPRLLDRLDDPNEAVRDAALGALIQIGDRRAVTALARSRSMRDRREMRKILEAIATLGGDEALDYLSFVAASHDDEEIRALATAARARLERRQGTGGESPPRPAPTP